MLVAVFFCMCGNVGGGTWRGLLRATFLSAAKTIAQGTNPENL